MSIVELVVVIGVIVVLLAILLPGLHVARRNAVWAKSQSNLNQIHKFLTVYQGNYRDTIVPAAFDYSAQSNDPRVTVRRGVPPIGAELTGSWSDILWTENKLGPIITTAGAGAWDYRGDSPDRIYYQDESTDAPNVLRSAEKMTNVVNGTEATPFGTGTNEAERGDPGYFAANRFFALTTNGGKWFGMGQIQRPAQSVYLVDSYDGEVTTQVGVDNATYQVDHVDFRYAGDLCLMLLMDGHVESRESWTSLRKLEESSQLRFLNLDKQKPFYLP